MLPSNSRCSAVRFEVPAQQRLYTPQYYEAKSVLVCLGLFFLPLATDPDHVTFVSNS
jgi:hypothetical protein